MRAAYYAYIIIVLIVIIWIYYFQFRKYPCKRQQFEEIQFKTGDLILFKACNNFYPVMHASYFGHVGMIIMRDNIPYIFEAANTRGMDVRPDQKKGVFVSPLYERIARYKGKAYHKPLNKYMTDGQINGLKHFINYAIKNMEYDIDVFSGGIKNGLGIGRCNHGTNCGQILYLAMIACGLLPLEYYRKKIFHHLKYVTNIKHLDNDFEYGKLTEIYCAPIGETIANVC
jgi:hypothetical protein